MYIMMYMRASRAAQQEVAIDSRSVVRALRALSLSRLQLNPGR